MKLKDCPECGSDDLEVDSTWCSSWVECSGCGHKLQHACSEDAICKRWNKLSKSKGESK